MSFQESMPGLSTIATGNDMYSLAFPFTVNGRFYDRALDWVLEIGFLVSLSPPEELYTPSKLLLFRQFSFTLDDLRSLLSVDAPSLALLTRLTRLDAAVRDGSAQILGTGRYRRTAAAAAELLKSPSRQVFYFYWIPVVDALLCSVSYEVFLEDVASPDVAFRYSTLQSLESFTLELDPNEGLPDPATFLQQRRAVMDDDPTVMDISSPTPSNDDETTDLRFIFNRLTVCLLMFIRIDPSGFPHSYVMKYAGKTLRDHRPLEALGFYTYLVDVLLEIGTTPYEGDNPEKSRKTNLYFMYQRRGNCLFDGERYDDVIENCKLAIDLSPLSPAPYHLRGRAYYRQHLHEEAVVEFTEAIRLIQLELVDLANDNAPNDLNLVPLRDRNQCIFSLAQVLSGRAMALLSLRRTDEALVDINEAIRLHPNEDQYLRTRECILKNAVSTSEKLCHDSCVKGDQAYAANDLEQAIRFYSFALKQRPQLVYLMERRALCYLKLKRRQEAWDDYTRMLELQPDHEGATVVVQRLRTVHLQEEEVWMKTCSFCKKRSREVLMRCTRCKAAMYCNRNCQTRAWRAGHNRECRKLKAERKEGMERARRGEIVGYIPGNGMRFWEE